MNMKIYIAPSCGNFTVDDCWAHIAA